MIIDHKGNRLAGGLDGMSWRPGHLHDQLGTAVDINAGQWKRKAYERRRVSSIARRVRMKHLPAAEAADVRYHECRSFGWSPLIPAVREWFFGLNADSRRELVALARRGGVAYARAAWDKPQLVTVTSNAARGRGVSNL